MRCGRALSKRRMPERFMRRILPFLAFALQRLRTARPDVVDTVVGLAIAGVALVQVAPDLHGAAPTGVSVLGIAALTGGLAWRRRHPLLLVPVAVTIIVAQAGLAEHVPLPDAALLAYLLIDYSVGAHTGRRSAVVGLLVLVAGIFAYTLISSAAGSFSPVFPLVVGLPPWFAGRALRARRELSIKLADRSGQLEAEREELADLAVRSERARIARELHDVVAHCVSLMVIQAAGGQRVVEADPNAAMHALDAIVHAGDQALRELAHLVGLLDGLAASGATSDFGSARRASVACGTGGHARYVGCGGRHSPPARHRCGGISNRSGGNHERGQARGPRRAEGERAAQRTPARARDPRRRAQHAALARDPQRRAWSFRYA